MTTCCAPRHRLVITVPGRRLVAGGGFESPFRSWVRDFRRSLRLAAGLRLPNLRSCRCQARALASSSRLARNWGGRPSVAVHNFNSSARWAVGYFQDPDDHLWEFLFNPAFLPEN
jgi:hypothetical protein